MITGETLRNLRESAGMKAQVVAERAGLTKQQLSKIESGVRAIEINEYVAIMGAMGYPAGDHLPNTIGDDVATYLPFIQMLRQTHQSNLPALQVLLQTTIRAFDDNFQRGAASSISDASGVPSARPSLNRDDVQVPAIPAGGHRPAGFDGGGSGARGQREVFGSPKKPRKP